MPETATSIPTGTYTLTVSTHEIVLLEMATEARLDTLRKLRAELVAGGNDTETVDSTIATTEMLLAKVKATPATFPASA